MEIILYFFACIPFYLVGAFPTGYLLAKRAGVDITKSGSGNVGATNVSRLLGRKAGMLTLVIDIIKGFLPLCLASLIIDLSIVSYLSIALVAGHCFSIPGKLKGGKGVATIFGAFLFLNTYAALFGISIFGLLLIIFKMVSLASIAGIISSVFFSIITDKPDYIVYPLAILSLLITYRHKDNLKRLMEGTEKEISFGKKTPD